MFQSVTHSSIHLSKTPLCSVDFPGLAEECDLYIWTGGKFLIAILLKNIAN